MCELEEELEEGEVGDSEGEGLSYYDNWNRDFWPMHSLIMSDEKQEKKHSARSI